MTRECLDFCKRWQGNDRATIKAEENAMAKRTKMIAVTVPISLTMHEDWLPFEGLGRLCGYSVATTVLAYTVPVARYATQPLA